MTVADGLLVAVAVVVACLAVRRRGLRPAALALAVLACTACALALPPPPFLARWLFACWPAPAAALVVHAFKGCAARAWWTAAVFLLAGLGVAAAREVPWVAALPEAVRATLLLYAYRATRLAALTVVVASAGRPRSAGQGVAVVLALSALWDLAPWFLGDPWQRWAGARVLAGTTWVVVGVVVGLEGRQQAP